MTELKDSDVFGKTFFSSAISSYQLFCEICPAGQSLIPKRRVTALTLRMMGNECTHAHRSRVVTPGTHTLYSDSERVANRLGLICLIIESPMRSSEALWEIEMFLQFLAGTIWGSCLLTFRRFLVCDVVVSTGVWLSVPSV